MGTINDLRLWDNMSLYKQRNEQFRLVSRVRIPAKSKEEEKESEQLELELELEIEFNTSEA